MLFKKNSRIILIEFYLYLVMEMIFLENIITIPQINGDRKYWFIRTDKGILFDEFYFDGFVGIGWNSFSDIKYIKDTIIDKILKHMDKNAEKNRELEAKIHELEVQLPKQIIKNTVNNNKE